MSEITRIGVDTSKAVFTLHGVDTAGGAVLRLSLRRAQLLPYLHKLPPTEIALEACASAHHWGRLFTTLGHTVRLIPPQYVKPYVKRGKNDRNDAEAICEAASRPGMRFVPIKSAQRQAEALVLKTRATFVGLRSQLIHTLRSQAAEFGIIAAKGTSQVKPLLAAIAGADLPADSKEMLALLGERIAELDRTIKQLESKVLVMHKANRISRLLATIPGIGPITALTLALEVDPAGFKSGRHLSAWLGLTPQEHSTGGKPCLGGISHAGHERLRSLLVSGAMAVIRCTTRPGNTLASAWLLALLRRRPRKLAAVALANKMGRIAWAMMQSGEPYRPDLAAATAAA
jgi:transposase